MTLHHSGHDCNTCRRRYARACDGSGADHRCGTKVPHRHCACYLSMPLDAEQCDLCVLEGCVPLDVDEMEWDGETYPSFRRRRTVAPHPSLYVTMFAVASGAITPFQRPSR